MKKRGQLYFSALVLILLTVLMTACGSSGAANTQRTSTTGHESNLGRPLAITRGSTPSITSSTNRRCWWFICITPTPTPTPVPTATATSQPTPTQVPAPTPTPTQVPMPTPVPTATSEPTPTPTLTPAPIPTPTQAPAPTPTPTPGTGYTTSADAAQAVFNLINQERASNGLSALQWSNALVTSAHLHNVAMFQAGTLSHQLPGEADLGTRISAQGVNWTMCAENIGYGWGDATQAATGLNQAMFNETPPNDGHRQNILSDATIVGIDVIVNTQTSQVWLTEDFARTA